MSTDFGPNLFAFGQFSVCPRTVLTQDNGSLVRECLLQIYTYVVACLIPRITELYQSFPKQALVFTCLHYKSFENTLGKGDSVFCLYGELSAAFIKIEIVDCKLSQFGRDLNLLFGKGISPLFTKQDSFCCETLLV